MLCERAEGRDKEIKIKKTKRNFNFHDTCVSQLDYFLNVNCSPC